jgi:hypothetical protein
VTTVLQTVAGSHGSEHHIIEARDGTPYCDCSGWKFSRASPKSCKHLERYLATAKRRAVAGSSPAAPASGGQSSIGKDRNGASVYAGDWLRDKRTGFAARAARLNSDDYFVSTDENWIISTRDSVLFIPAFGEEIPGDKVAECDRAAYRRARMGGVARPSLPAVSLDGPSVFEKLDWL